MSNPPADSGNPVTLFLSYARTDEAKARRLATALEAQGYVVWWDALIEGGAAFARSIAEALDSADAVLVLWSARSVESDWVRDEAAQGREHHTLVPLSLDGTAPPLGFRQYQVIDLSHWHGRKGAPEIAAIERAIALVLGQAAIPSHPRSSPSVTRRGAMLGGSAAAALTIGGGAWLAWDRGWIGGSKEESIAVLPFKNLSGDPSQAYFSEGLTEEVRAALIRLNALRVLAATSTTAAEDGDGEAKSVAHKLDVAYLLGGSVRRNGAMLRIGVELTDGATGFSRWSTTVNRKLTDIFAVQSEIARMVAQALSIQIATDEPAPGGTRNPKAYEDYLRGKALYNLAKDEATDREARANFELAIEADPKFGLAHAALSRVLSSLAASSAEASELKSLYSAAILQADRAIELAPTLAEGHLARAYALFAGRLDVRGARASYEKAYQLGRGNADIALLYALYAARTRRFAQAHGVIDRALALDPLNPRTWRAAGSIDLATGQPQSSLARFDKALALNPSISNANALKGFALIRLGRLKEARSALDKEPSAMFRLTGLAILGDKTGDRGLAEKSFDALVSEIGDSALYQQAEVLAQWGRDADALDRLERARAVGDSGLTQLVTDPFLAPLAKQARYRALVRSIGFA